MTTREPSGCTASARRSRFRVLLFGGAPIGIVGVIALVIGILGGLGSAAESICQMTGIGSSAAGSPSPGPSLPMSVSPSTSPSITSSPKLSVSPSALRAYPPSDWKSYVDDPLTGIGAFLRTQDDDGSSCRFDSGTGYRATVTRDEMEQCGGPKDIYTDAAIVGETRYLSSKGGMV